MKSGLKKIRPDHRDFDFLKSHQHLFGAATPIFPEEFNVDAGIWCPSQEQAIAVTGMDTIPPLPYGCTDYTTTDLCMDEDGVQYNPMLLENITHANANGGADIRVALKAAIKVFNRTAYFNIRPAGFYDPFDAARLAIASAQPEKRSVSVGSIWYWGEDTEGSLPMPTELHLAGPWHNFKVCGWKTIDGSPELIVKPLTGRFNTIKREVFNAVMAQSGCAMFTISKTAPQDIQFVDLSWVQYIVSYVRSLIGL